MSRRRPPARAATPDRWPCTDVDAERRLLGQVLAYADRVLAPVCRAGVDAETFARAAHQTIWRTLSAEAAAGRMIDLASIVAALRRANTLDEVGGPAYVAALTDGLPRWTPTAADQHARDLVQLARHRALSARVRGLSEAIDASDGRQAAGIRAQLCEALAAFDGVGADDELPALRTLRATLADPIEPLTWRIDGWQPAGTRVLLAAAAKVGKTTLIGSLVRGLVDGADFLAGARVHVVPGTVCVVDLEMSRRQLVAWYRVQDIRADDRVLLLPLRGRARTLNLLDAGIRRQWAETLRRHHVAYLVVDCLRPLLDALGLDEHREAGRLLEAFDALCVEAGIAEACVVHHMGHVGERSRGDSRLRDWPDVEWRLVRHDTEDPASARYLAAYGRDVDQSEQALAYDPLTRRLTIAGGSRRDVRLDEALVDVLAVLDAAAPEALTARALERACDEAGSAHGRDVIRAAIAYGRRTGALQVEPGPRRAQLHRRGERASARECADAGAAHWPRECAECASPLWGDAALSAHSAGADESGTAPEAPRALGGGAPVAEEDLDDEYTVPR